MKGIGERIRRPWRYAKHSRTLKRRIFVIFLIITSIPILLIGMISYFAIHATIHNKIAGGIQNSLHQVVANTENLLDGLNLASQQLVYTGWVGSDLQRYLTDTDLVDRYHDQKEITTNFQLIANTNPNLGLFFYYSPAQQKTLFQTRDLRPDFDPFRETNLTAQYRMEIHAPHETAGKDKAFVFSLARPVDLSGRSDFLIYMESDAEAFASLFQENQYGMSVAHVMVNDSGRIAYSEDEKAFPVGAEYRFTSGKGGHYRTYKQSYLFEEKSESQGWGLVAVIPRTAMLKETSAWVLRTVFIAVGSLFVSLLLGLSLWRTVQRPLIDLTRQIRQLGSNQFDSAISPTKIEEFDYVLYQFDVMRERVLELMDEVKLQEADKRYLAIEKLAAQINPHFLYNTLNTIQWLAHSKGNEDIVGLVAVFVRLLRYNLGKDGGLVTIRQELESLQDYVRLQEIRYDYQFVVDVQADKAVLDSRVPRFILQPLVENALYHGNLDDGDKIEVGIYARDERFAVFSVKDEGAGMSDAQIAKLMAGKPEEREQTGMGIGLHYVMTMLRVHYGQDAEMTIDSKMGQGTTITIRIPILRGEEDVNQNISRG